MDPINEIAKKHNLMVIEDAAQSVGGKYKGRSAGLLGDIGGFSLNGSKNLPAGEGGIVTTNDDELYLRARQMSMFGEQVVPKGSIRLYDAEIMGFNYRNNEMADAVCRSFLRRYDKLQALLPPHLASVQDPALPGAAGNHRHPRQAFPLGGSQGAAGGRGGSV
jgi:dTDP-4-amino-4,6-dideoxygalactose transaminase